MSPLSNAPSLNKGAIQVIEGSRPIYTIYFQYNPGKVSRSLKPRWQKDEKSIRPMRAEGVPDETIKLEVEIDAADQLENAEGPGIYPQISALEVLVYPKVDDVTSTILLLKKLGVMKVASLEAPTVLLVWGKNRVIPVKLTDISISEEAHDKDLNPIRAKVSLNMQVLSYNDLFVGQPGFDQYKTYHQNKEKWAAKAR